ncbi:MAG: hypothetical protein SVQ76_02735 [Candidatus Nanohaloarchaea archaeon]|nr:hypothetical protein [Candidatus Nanohaloarchaea archaeon]
MDELLAFGHVFLITLGLLLATAVLLGGIWNTSDEGVIPDRKTGRVDSEDPRPGRQIRELEHDRSPSLSSGGRGPAIRGEGEA